MQKYLEIAKIFSRLTTVRCSISDAKTPQNCQIFLAAHCRSPRYFLNQKDIQNFLAAHYRSPLGKGKMVRVPLWFFAVRLS
jgi:hypothetical protein